MELSIVIPVFNEEKNLPGLLHNLGRLPGLLGVPFEIIAVDDGSTDASGDILFEARKKLPSLRVARNEENRGMGAAILEGCRLASGRFTVWTMAELSERREDIRAIYQRLEEGDDLVIASRAMKGGDYGELGRIKAGLSHLFSYAARYLFGVPVHDLTNAFRGMKSRLPLDLDLTCRDFAISPELAIKARRAGRKLSEIPTVYHYRKEGHSQFRVLQMGWKYSLLLLLRFKPARKKESRL